MRGLKVLVTGSNGLVGSALVEELAQEDPLEIIKLSRKECDLKDFDSVCSFFMKYHPDVVFHNAASVYGIGGNCKNKGSVILDNLLINTHVIEACRLARVKKIVAMGTVASYPILDVKLLSEDLIWSGRPHSSEDSYGHAKRTMLAQLEAYKEQYGLDFSFIISTNLYGKYDKFDLNHGHVIPSLIRKFHNAILENSDVNIWGDGTASRDFLYSKDLARALILIMKNFSGPINVGSGIETPIRKVVDCLVECFNFSNKVIWDKSKSNGRKFVGLDLSKLSSLHFKSNYDIKSGLDETVKWYIHNITQPDLIRIL